MDSTVVPLSQDLTSGLEDAFQRAIESRGPEIGALGQRYGLQSMHVFRRDNRALITFEVDDPEQFRRIVADPDFQVLGQELAGVVDLQQIGWASAWDEVFSWPGPNLDSDV